MKLTVLAVSREQDDCFYNGLSQSDIESIETFSGKAAAICYMKEPYFGSYVSNSEKAKVRFDRVIGTGHHSISDHAFVSVLFEDIPKMTAMILNSFGFYNTSEKSGRYTIMNSDKETMEKYAKNYALYNEWIEVFNKLIKEYDDTIEDKLREKLALENARYMLSVFTPSTTMLYTTSIRMWSYIRQFCRDYISAWNDGGASLDLKRTKFNDELLKCIKDLYESLTLANIYSEKIVDNKGRGCKFLARQTFYNIEDAEERYSDAYLIEYKSSFADLAQQQRHRTLDYFMCFDGSETMNFYVPKLLRGTDYEREWLCDLESISDTFPIATLVKVIETGTISNFMLKCDERLCGRVQLETMDTIRTNLLKFERCWRKSPFMIDQLKRHFRDGKVIMKCGNIQCKEPCHWGPIKAQEKLI